MLQAALIPRQVGVTPNVDADMVQKAFDVDDIEVRVEPGVGDLVEHDGAPAGKDLVAALVPASGLFAHAELQLHTILTAQVVSAYVIAEVALHGERHRRKLGDLQPGNGEPLQTPCERVVQPGGVLVDRDGLSIEGEQWCVVVTGGGTGIGRATCVRLAEEGAAVAVTDVRPNEAAETVRLVEAAGGSATAYELDVTDESATQRVFAKAAEAMGGLDGLFANAGITTGGRIQELTLDDWDREIAVNLTGPFLSIKHALPYLIDSVRANCVCPGFVATKIVEHAIETAADTTTPRSEHRPAARLRPPMSRAGEPSEIASVVTFLLSDDASFMTGSAVMADGGYTSI